MEILGEPRVIDSRAGSVALPPPGLFIDGRFVPACGGGTFTTVQPATGEPLAAVAEAQPADVDNAVSAAQHAYTTRWSGLELTERAAILHRVADLIEERVDEFALIESLDTGKPLRDTRGGEIAEAAVWFRYFADVGQWLRSHVVPAPRGYLNYTLREPYGVVGAITPWNYPLILAATKTAPALGVGNCVILKPAEQAPLSALALAGLFNEAGMPPGVFNVLPGFGETAGRAIVEHPGVGMVTFTGSTETGRDVLRRAADVTKPVTVELGGKSPIVVFADADLEVAASAALWGFCINQGQLCSAATRLLVERPVHDEFVEALAEKACALRIGDPLEPDTQLGSLISAEQFQRVAGYVQRGLHQQARLVTGGQRVTVSGCEAGHFFQPTIFDRVDPRSPLAQEEIFGPVLSVLEFDDEEQATRLANQVDYGLAAVVWTNDLARAHQLAEQIEAGVIYVNTINVGTPASVYSPYKQSGFGFEGGMEHAASFTRQKSVFISMGPRGPVL